MRYFLPLLIVLISLICGMSVNLIIDILYKRREALSNECISMIDDQGWGKYLLFPWEFIHCEKRKTNRVIIINLVFIMIGYWLWYAPLGAIQIGWGLPLAMYFAIVIVMDIEHRVVLHEVSLLGVIIGLAFGLIRHGWLSTISGGVVGFGIMLIMYQLGHIYIQARMKGRGQDDSMDALGFGDVNISGVIGLILGWPGVVSGLVIGVLIGGVISTLYLLYRKLSNQYVEFEAVPYAPFLVMGAAIVIYFKNLFF